MVDTETPDTEKDIEKEAAANVAFYLDVLKDLENGPLTRIVINARVRRPKSLRTR